VLYPYLILTEYPVLGDGWLL